MATEPEKVTESVVAPSAPQQQYEPCISWIENGGEFQTAFRKNHQLWNRVQIRHACQLAEGYAAYRLAAKEAEISRLTADRDHSNSLVDSLRHERNVLQKIHAELEAVNASLTQQVEELRKLLARLSAMSKYKCPGFEDKTHEELMANPNHVQLCTACAVETKLASLAKGEKAQK